MNDDARGVMFVVFLGVALMTYWCWELIASVLALQFVAIVFVLIWAGFEGIGKAIGWLWGKLKENVQ